MGDFQQHFACPGSNVDLSQWQTSTSNALYSAMWTTSSAAISIPHFDRVEKGLQQNKLECYYHRTTSKTYGTFGMRCRECSYAVVVEWPKSLTTEEASIAQQLLASFTHGRPFPEEFQNTAFTDMPPPPPPPPPARVTLTPAPGYNSLNAEPVAAN